MNRFTVPTHISEGFYKEKGSKFYAFAYPIADTGAVTERLEALRKEYHDARHHCYAYILGLKQQQWRANDDGEPNHSAGDPILGQIRSAGLTNCLVVVVRYFGGTKLGVGGLISAYKNAAEAALAQVQTKTVASRTDFKLTYPYGRTSDVERCLAAFDIDYYQKEYTADCIVWGGIVDEDFDMFQEQLMLWSDVEIALEART